jgi:hypothetical protein
MPQGEVAIALFVISLFVMAAGSACTNCLYCAHKSDNPHQYPRIIRKNTQASCPHRSGESVRKGGKIDPTVQNGVVNQRVPKLIWKQQGPGWASGIVNYSGIRVFSRRAAVKVVGHEQSKRLRNIRCDRRREF